MLNAKNKNKQMKQKSEIFEEQKYDSFDLFKEVRCITGEKFQHL